MFVNFSSFSIVLHGKNSGLIVMAGQMYLLPQYTLYVTLIDKYFKSILRSLIFVIEECKYNNQRYQEVFDVSLKCHKQWLKNFHKVL